MHQRPLRYLHCISDIKRHSLCGLVDFVYGLEYGCVNGGMMTRALHFDGEGGSPLVRF